MIFFGLFGGAALNMVQRDSVKSVQIDTLFGILWAKHRDAIVTLNKKPESNTLVAVQPCHLVPSTMN